MNRNYFINGSITVFLSLILCVCILFVNITFEFYKSFAAKSIIQNSLELTAYTATADFNRVLEDTYGLLKSSKSEKELSENLSKHLQNSLKSADIICDEELFDDIFDANKNIINIDLKSLEVKGISGSELYNPEVLEKQIVEYMKYRGPIIIGENFLKKINVFKSLNKIEKIIENKNHYDSSLSDIQIHFNKIMEDYAGIKKLQSSNIYSEYRFLLSRMLDKSNAHNIIDTDALLLFINENTYFDKAIKNQNSNNMDIVNDENYIILKNIKSNEYIEYAFNLKKHEELIEAVYQEYIDAEQFFEQNGDILDDEGTPDELIIEASRMYSVLDKYGFVVDLVDDFEKIKEEAMDRFKEKMSFTVQDVSHNYNTYNKIQVNLEDINKELKKLKEDTLQEVSDNLNLYSQSVQQIEEGDIKRTFSADVDEEINGINIDELNIMIEKVNQSIIFCKNFENKIKSIEYRHINLCDSNLIIKNFDFQSNRIDMSKYSEEEHNKNMVNYSNLGELFESENIDKNNIKNIEETEFYRYIAAHSNINIEKDINVHSKVDNINTIIKRSYNKSESLNEESFYVPDSGNIYEDLATVLFSEEVSNENTSSPNISSVSCDDKTVDNSKEIADSQMNYFSNSVGNFFKKFSFDSENLENIRNDLYIMAYMNDKFINQTDIKTDDHFINEEIEYILFGSKGDKKFSNKEKTEALIFSTRYLLNTTYAYTDSEIRTYTLSLAVSLAGITGFGVPIIQNVLILMISFAESVLDVKTLVDGEAVVIYKSFNTWHLKPSQITKEVIEETSKTIVNHSMDNLFDKINNYYDKKTDECIENVIGEFERLSDDAIESTINSVVSTIMAPIEAKLIIVNNEISDINLIDSYDSLLENVSTGKKSYDYILKNACNFFMRERITEVENKIKRVGQINSENVSQYIENLIKDERNILINKIRNDFLGSVQKNIKEELIAAEKKGKSALNEKINKYFDDLNLSYSNSSESDNSTFERSSFLTMNYAEYMDLYIIISMISGNKDEILLRMADIIKINMVLIEGEGNFKLNNAYTMFHFIAKAKVNARNININASNVNDEEERKIILSDEIICEATYGY